MTGILNALGLVLLLIIALVGVYLAVKRWEAKQETKR